MSKGQLLIHPVDAGFSPDPGSISEFLTETGFIGKEITPSSWMVGEQFFQQLTFMGCSPNIETEPESNGEFVHISIERLQQPELRFSQHARPCRCSACGKPVVKSWGDLVMEDRGIHCNHCQHLHSDWRQLRWRSDAGRGRFFITVHSIYPGEAQPVPALMQQLESLTNQQWRYFYRHSL